MWTFLGATLALAGVPDGVRPAAAPPDLPAQYASWVSETGAPNSTLACEPLWSEHALLCFKVREGRVMRWVTNRDLARWKTDLAGLRTLVAARAEAILEDQPTRTSVADMDASYWVAAEGDGWAAAGLLHPDRLAARMGGGPILVAAPTTNVLLAWKPGNPELDRVMGIGIRKMFDEEPEPVTPMMHQWTGTRWAPFGSAVPVETAPAPAAPSPTPAAPEKAAVPQHTSPG